jgi:hypothetical protein
MNAATHTFTADAANFDVILALVGEFGEPDHTAVDADEVMLSWEIGRGAALTMYVMEGTFVSASIDLDETRTRVRALRTKHGDVAARVCRMAVNKWIASRA